MRRFSDVVVGSGPCGFAAALALSDLGRHVALVDFGDSPFVERAAFSGSSTVALKGEGERARVFDYPSSLVVDAAGKHLPLSSARGGLSKVWGAGILIRDRNDCPELAPVFDELEPAFERLAQVLPIVGCDDEISERFPWPLPSVPGPHSRRYGDMLDLLGGSNGDVLVGHARAAIDAGGSRCIRCGLCLNGCPRDLFFSADVGLRGLVDRGQCEFVEGPVLRVGQTPEGVRVELQDGEIRADRVILALGPIATPALLQRSGLAPNRITVRDSAVFYTALLNNAAAEGDEGDFTAAQAAVYSARSGADDFQLSLYESNPEYADRLAALIPASRLTLRPPAAVIRRLNAGIGFLDSSVSGTLILSFDGRRTVVSREQPPGIRGRARGVMRRVGIRLREHGIRPIPGAILIPPAGSGYHCGASLPIGGEAVALDGTLKVASRIMIADASSLPKIWAGSHTFTAMANAYRMASLSG